MVQWGKLITSAIMGVAVALGLAGASPVVHTCCVCSAPCASRARHRCVVEGMQTDADTNAGLRPAKVAINGRTHYYQIPATPRGTLFVFPGCTRTGYGYWPYGAGGCQECAGMPEDVSAAKQALARGYAIVVFTAGGKSLCWTTATDGKFIRTAIPQFLAKHPELKGKPVYVTGASSGGGLMQRNLGSLGVPIDGVIAVVATSTDVPDLVRGLRGQKPPPIVWITMAQAKEISTAKDHVAKYKRYAPAAMASVAERKITPSYFSDRHPLITPQQSAQMAAKLRELGVIKADGTLAGDPKKNRAWLRKLSELPFLKNKNFPVAPFQKAVLLQAVMVAQARHEHVADYMTAALMWLESKGKTDFGALASKYRVVKPAALTAARQIDGAEPTPSSAFAYGGSAGGRALLTVIPSVPEQPPLFVTQPPFLTLEQPPTVPQVTSPPLVVPGVASLPVVPWNDSIPVADFTPTDLTSSDVTAP